MHAHSTLVLATEYDLQWNFLKIIIINQSMSLPDALTFFFISFVTVPFRSCSVYVPFSSIFTVLDFIWHTAWILLCVLT